MNMPSNEIRLAESTNVLAKSGDAVKRPRRELTCINSVIKQQRQGHSTEEPEFLEKGTQTSDSR